MTSRKEWIAGLVGLALASPMVQAQGPLGLPGGTGVIRNPESFCTLYR
jgi:hypothetical protein